MLHLDRTGRELTDDNVWIHECRREIASLDAIIERLHTDDAADGSDSRSISGATTTNRSPLLQVKTRGSHESVLRKAEAASPDTTPSPDPAPKDPSDGLARYRDTVAATKPRDIDKALRDLRKANAPITVAAVAARSGVSRKTIYKTQGRRRHDRPVPAASAGGRAHRVWRGGCCRCPAPYAGGTGEVAGREESAHTRVAAAGQ